METPETYARHLASYISSPTKIEALTRIEFGRAPALHKIADMRVAVEKKGDRHYRSARVEYLREQQAAMDEAKRLLKKAEAVVQAEHEAETLRIPREPVGNPFLMSYRLTRALAESVAADFRISPAQLLGKGRSRIFVEARAVVVKLAVDAGFAFAEVGRRLGRDHSTIIYRYHQFDIDHKRSARVRASYARHLKLRDEAEREMAAQLQDNEVEQAA